MRVSIRLLVILITLLVIYSCNKKSPLGSFDPAPNIQAKIEGFEVQAILKGEGEWLSIAEDPDGRLLISPRYGKLLRVEINRKGLIIDTLDIGVTDCQGMLYAYDHLYMMGSGEDGIRGIYKVRDKDGQGNFGAPALLLEMPRNGDHSGHTLALGPEGLIYFLTGNENKPPDVDNISFVSEDWQTDHLMPLRSIYGSSQGPPGGFVLRTDSIGSFWQFLAFGLRNPYDMCFNKEGDLFTFDSDMEWDFGLPWYRPTRVNHLVSGADFAWREITAKRFDYYPDIWPSVMDLGRGSPTGTVFGTGARFPVKYQNALFLGDWSYGKIYAMHLKRSGSTYTGEYEVFATGKPLNITDMIVSKDGALYFVTGGNGTDTGLFRIIYKDEVRDQPEQEAINPATLLRRKLENFHFMTDSTGLSVAFANIGNEDRFVRNAARVIIERNPIQLWVDKINDQHTQTAHINYLTALIRKDTSNQYTSVILSSLLSLPLEALSEEEKLNVLRLITLFCIRDNSIRVSDYISLYNFVNPLYPADSELLNKELSRVLSYLSIKTNQGKEVIERTFRLIETTSNSSQLIHYLEVLRLIRNGWSTPTRLAYRYWVDYAISNFQGGSLFQYFIGEIKKDFESNLSDSQRRTLDKLTPGTLTKNYEGPFTKKSVVRGIKSQTGEYVKNWEFEDLEFSLELVNSPRNNRERDFHRGKKMYEQGLCYNCHYMLDRGGSFGPELTLAGNSFGVEELVRTILYPSETINSRFQGTSFNLLNGDILEGRVISESNTHFVISKDWTGTLVEEIPKSAVSSSAPSPISEMTPGLLNTMQKDEILDLLYFITEIPARIDDPLSFDLFEEDTFVEKGDSTYVEIINYSDQGDLFYSLNDTLISSYSPYVEPIVIHSTSIIRAYKKAGGDQSPVKSRTVHFYNKDLNGLHFAIFTNVEERFSRSSSKVPDLEGTCLSFNVKDLIQDQNNFEVEFTGHLKIDEPGEYTFYTIQDDAVKLTIDGELVIDQSSNTWGGSGEGKISLKSGFIPIKVEFYDQLSTEYLMVEYEGPGRERIAIPTENLYFGNLKIL